MQNDKIRENMAASVVMRQTNNIKCVNGPVSLHSLRSGINELDLLCSWDAIGDLKRKVLRQVASFRQLQKPAVTCIIISCHRSEELLRIIAVAVERKYINFGGYFTHRA